MPAQTSLRCPECGAANPIGNTYCDQCNARLTRGLMPSGGDEQPESAGQEEEAPSGLLAQLDRSGRQRSGSAQAPSGAGQSFGVPEWLRDLEAEAGGRGEPGAGLSVGQPDEPPVAAADLYAAKPAMPASPSGDIGGMADWLAEPEPGDIGAGIGDRQEQFPESAAAQPPPAFGPSEVPDWLLEMAPPEIVGRKPAAEPTQSAAPPAAPRPAPPGAAEIPDWLLDVAPPDVAAPAAAPAGVDELPERRLQEPAGAGLHDIPDWLSDIGADTVPFAGEGAGVGGPTEEQVPEVLAPDSFGVPDWLSDIAPDEVSGGPEAAEADEWPEQRPPGPAAPGPAEVPDWLAEIAADESDLLPELTDEPDLSAMLADAAAAATATEGVGLPDWLQDLEPDSGAAEIQPGEAPPPALPTAPAEAEGVPDWLRAVDAGASGAPVAAPAGGAHAAQVPDWLTDLRPEDTVEEGPPVSAAVGPLGPPPGTGPVEAAIPEWLQAMREQQQSPGVAPEDEPVETTGLLEGLRGVIPAQSIEVPAPLPEVAPEVGEAAAARAQLLQSLLVPAGEKAPVEARKREVSTGERIARWLVFAVVVLPIAVVVGWPVFAGESEVLILTEPQSASAEDLFEAIEGLEAGDVALVAFEYGPAEAGELGVLAKPILWHLEEKGAVIWVRTTRSDGQALADALRVDMSITEQYTPTYGSSAYVPGGAVGVARALARCDRQDPGSDPSECPDIVLVLAGQMAPLQWWVEQVQARDIRPPVVAAVGASVVPAANPYLAANGGRIAGLVGGLAGAAAYEAQLGNVLSPTTRMLNGLAAGHLTVAALMVVGALFYGLTGSRRRQGQ